MLRVRGLLGECLRRCAAGSLVGEGLAADRHQLAAGPEQAPPPALLGAGHLVHVEAVARGSHCLTLQAGSTIGSRSLGQTSAALTNEADIATIAAQLAALTRHVDELENQLKERANEQQERAETQQERIDLAARELAEVSHRLQAAANALRESI